MTSIVDTLKAAIAKSGVPYLRMERECGVNRLCVSRFMRGVSSLSLEQADMLARYFGLVLVPEKRPARRTRKGE